MNFKQAELMGVFSVLPTGTIDTYYLDKFSNNYFTAGESIVLDELITELSSLSIVPRGTKAKEIRINGTARKTITPDIIAGKSSLTTNELLQIQAGQVETIINGKVVDNFQVVKDRHLTKLKNGLTATQTRMSAELFLTGKVTLPESADVIDYGFNKVEEVKKNKGEIDWTLFIMDLVEKYKAKNKVYPTNIEVDSSIFKEMLNDENFREQVKAFGMAGAVANNKYPTLNILNYQISVLPHAEDAQGKAIDTDKLIVLSNNSEFVKGYVGLSYAENNQLKLFSGEYLVDEVTEKDPATQYFTLMSGFVPVIPMPQRIQRYKLTLEEKKK